MSRGREDSKNNLIKTLALCLSGPSGWLSLLYWFCPQVDGYQRVTQCLLQTQFPEKFHVCKQIFAHNIGVQKLARASVGPRLNNSE